jgi:hypothetical protein
LRRPQKVELELSQEIQRVLAMVNVGTSLIGDAETVGGEKDQKQ